MLYCKLSQNFADLTNIESFICAIFDPNNLFADKEIHYLQFLIINKCRDQVPGIKPSDH